MEGFLKFLLIAAIIVIGIARKSKKDARKASTTIPPADMDNGRPYNVDLEEVFRVPMFDAEPPGTTEERKTPRLKRYSSSATSSLHSAPSTTPSAPSATDAQPLVSADSLEDVRRGFIWSQILERKY